MLRLDASYVDKFKDDQITDDLLTQININVTTISDMNIQITSAIEEQRKVASEVNHIARDITTLSDQVSNQASILVNTVSKFKV